MTIRQITNELENLKRENSNLKSTIELIRENEKVMKTENKFLRDSILTHERNSVIYQNIITQNDALDINVIQSLERSLYLLKTAEDVNKGFCLINIEKLVEEVRNFRIKTKAKVEASMMSGNNFRPSTTQSEYNFNLHNFTYDNLTLPISEVRTERSNDKNESDYYQCEQIGSLTRSAKRAEKIDPATMKPAGIKSCKQRTFSSKYSAHHMCEIGSLKDLSP